MCGQCHHLGNNMRGQFKLIQSINLPKVVTLGSELYGGWLQYKMLAEQNSINWGCPRTYCSGGRIQGDCQSTLGCTYSGFTHKAGITTEHTELTKVCDMRWDWIGPPPEVQIVRQPEDIIPILDRMQRGLWTQPAIQQYVTMPNTNFHIYASKK